MKRQFLFLALAGCLYAFSGVAIACEYVPGETKFLDYAYCRYPKDAIQVVDLPDDACWDQCVYLLEAFRPAQLLAVVRERNGKEEHSINSRHNIGNPCYLTMAACEQALKDFEAGNQ